MQVVSLFKIKDVRSLIEHENVLAFNNTRQSTISIYSKKNNDLVKLNLSIVWLKAIANIKALKWLYHVQVWFVIWIGRVNQIYFHI